MENKGSFWSAFYEQLASLKFTIFILFALAVSSLIGTLLPQGMTEQELAMRYGPGAATWIDFFGLSDLYHAGWFRMLLLLLGINLVVCTLERLPKTVKLVRFREQQMDPQKLLKFANHAQFSTPLLWEQAEPALEKIVAREFGAIHHLEKSSTAYGAIAEKGRWSLLMVYVVHLSVLVVLLGALIGSLWGFKAFMNIPEGEALDSAHMIRGHGVVTLPFEVRLDHFDVSFYEKGMPKEYRSDLTIIENGQEVLKRSIRVNDPLTYRGITFYQASYGANLKHAEIEIQNVKSGAKHNLSLPLEEMVTIPETQSRIMAMQYQENFSGFGPALILAVFTEGEKPVASRVLLNHPEFHGNQIQDYHVRVLSTEQSRYTGLQVKQDPGVWVVWFGFIAMVLGIAATYYTSHRKLWVWASIGNPSTKVIIAGKVNKNSLAFEREFEHVCERLRTELRAGSENVEDATLKSRKKTIEVKKI
jgi:cytochrome c biogenesis protein